MRYPNWTSAEISGCHFVFARLPLNDDLINYTTRDLWHVPGLGQMLIEIATVLGNNNRENASRIYPPRLKMLRLVFTGYYKMAAIAKMAAIDKMAAIVKNHKCFFFFFIDV